MVQRHLFVDANSTFGIAFPPIDFHHPTSWGSLCAHLLFSLFDVIFCVFSSDPMISSITGSRRDIHRFFHISRKKIATHTATINMVTNEQPNYTPCERTFVLITTKSFGKMPYDWQRQLGAFVINKIQ